MDAAQKPLERADTKPLADSGVKADPAADDKAAMIDIADITGKDAIIQKTKIARMQNALECPLGRFRKAHAAGKIVAGTGRNIA